MVEAEVVAAIVGAMGLLIAALASALFIQRQNNSKGNPNNLHQLWPLLELKLDQLQREASRQTATLETASGGISQSLLQIDRTLSKVELLVGACPTRGRKAEE